MRILQVVPFFGPAWGGVATVAYQLSRKLSERGHELTIATTDFKLDQEYRRSIAEHGVDVIPFHCVAHVSSFLFSPSMKAWLSATIADFDIVHLHDFRSYQNAIAHRVLQRHQIPYVLQPDNTLPRVITRKRLKWLYDVCFGFKILRDLSAFVAISEEEVKAARSCGISDQSVHLVYMGIDDNEYFANPPAYGSFRERHHISGKMILYLGRLNRSKGIDIVVRAFSKLSQRRDDVVLAIAGSDDGYQAQLEELISTLNISDKVRMTGYVDELDKVRAYVDADVFVHPVRYMGGVGLTPLEAIMCDTPVIVTKECGEVIEKANCGCFVEHGDADDLAEKMMYVITHPKESGEMVSRGKRYIEQHLSWDTIARDIEKLYENSMRHA
jgi:glycosyltransferase involved in cell wall biosynthesis